MSYPLIHIHDKEMASFWKKKLKLRFLNILKFSLFSFFKFKCLFFNEFSIVGDRTGLKCLLMYGRYYPPLTITPF